MLFQHLKPAKNYVVYLDSFLIVKGESADNDANDGVMSLAKCKRYAPASEAENSFSHALANLNDPSKWVCMGKGKFHAHQEWVVCSLEI